MAKDGSKFLICKGDSLKGKLDDWSARWRELRGRTPFFMMHGKEDLSDSTVDHIKKCREVLEKISVDVIIDSPGGKLSSSFEAGLILQSYCNYVAVVPRFAKSGATLFALGADEIIMGRWGELGPLDPQMTAIQGQRHYLMLPESALEAFHAARYAQREVLNHFESYTSYLIKVFGLSPQSAIQESIKLVEATIGKIYSNVSPFELGNSGRVLDVMQKYCLRLMKRGYKMRRESISKELVWDYPTHDFFIDFEEAKRIGLNVSEANADMQKLLDELEKDYSETYCLGVAAIAGTNGAKQVEKKSRKQNQADPATITNDDNGEQKVA